MGRWEVRRTVFLLLRDPRGISNLRFVEHDHGRCPDYQRIVDYYLASLHQQYRSPGLHPTAGFCVPHHRRHTLCTTSSEGQRWYLRIELDNCRSQLPHDIDHPARLCFWLHQCPKGSHSRQGFLRQPSFLRNDPLRQELRDRSKRWLSVFGLLSMEAQVLSRITGKNFKLKTQPPETQRPQTKIEAQPSADSETDVCVGVCVYAEEKRFVANVGFYLAKTEAQLVKSELPAVVKSETRQVAKDEPPVAKIEAQVVKDGPQIERQVAKDEMEGVKLEVKQSDRVETKFAEVDRPDTDPTSAAESGIVHPRRRRPPKASNGRKRRRSEEGEGIFHSNAHATVPCADESSTRKPQITEGTTTDLTSGSELPYTIEMFLRNATAESMGRRRRGKVTLESSDEDIVEDEDDERTRMTPATTTSITASSVVKQRRKTGGRKAVLIEPTAEGWETPQMYMKATATASKDAMKFVVALKEYIPEVQALLPHGRAPIATDMFEKFIVERSGILRALGASVVLPRGIQTVLRPRLIPQHSTMIETEDRELWRTSYLDTGSLLSFKYRIAIGDVVVDLEEFRAMVESGRRLFRFQNDYVELDGENIAKILSAEGKTPVKPGSMVLLRDVLSGDHGYSMTKQVEQTIARMQCVEAVDVPQELTAILRPYQVRGFRWVLSNLRSIRGCALLVDMGLGKTIQTIAVLLALKKNGCLDAAPALVVCPTSLITNWTREFSMFAPSLSVETVCGSASDRMHTINQTIGEKRKRQDARVGILSFS